MIFEKAERLKKLPPYLFAEIDKKKKAAIRAGRDIINLGIGDPDMPTPEFIIEALYEAAKDPRTHQYSLDEGMEDFRSAIGRWYKKRFNVELDPETQVLPLIGSKEGIAHLPLAAVNPGDVTLVPEPCYPPYRSGTLFAGGKPHYMPLLAGNGFLPDIEAVPADIARKARILYLNYPNNPTAAIAPLAFYKDVVSFAREHSVLVSSDAAYSEVYYDEKPASFLEADTEKEVAIEFHSLSKTFNMTGWRVGFAVGNREAIAGLRQVKSNLDSGIFMAIQRAATVALDYEGPFFEEMLSTYRGRRDTLVEGLNSLGFDVPKPKATFYVWIPVPEGYDSSSLCELLLEKASIVTTPGVGFGPSGEGYIRAALTVSKERLRKAVERIADLKI
jgi:LL-diaminopimelate aminotransferase